MNGLTKGQKWLARAMMPMAVGVSALCWMAFRPCEPIAQASEGPRVLNMPTVEIVGDLAIPEVSVEDLPKVPQASRRPMASHAKRDVVCTEKTPGARCSLEDSLTVGSPVLFCDCRK